MAQTLKVREVIAILEENGFELIRHEKTSHRTYKKRVSQDKTLTTQVSGHLNDDVPKGTLGSIRRQSKLGNKLR